MIERVDWVGSGSETGICEKMSNVVDSSLQVLQISYDLICP